MAVRLEFLTQDPDEMALATRYWAMDEEGAYLERVADLVPFRDVVQSGQIARQVREFSLAYDDNQCCYMCDGPIRVSGRADAKKTFQKSSFPCESCEDVLRRQKAEQQAQEQAEISKRLAYKNERNVSATLCYGELSDEAVILLLALDALLGQKLASGTFTISDCDDLSPKGGKHFIDRLLQEDVLLDDPIAAKPGTYFIKNGELWWYVHGIQYFLPPDADLGRGAAALRHLEEHVFTDSESLTDLWLDYALDDVMRYFDDQCSIYQHELEVEAVEKIKANVRHALRTYSVAELWSVMWKAVKDAASLANMQYYNRPKAAATIPNKIRKLVEQADQNGGIKHTWNRPDHHVAGSLGMVFSSLFGVDEYTPGKAVIESFDRLGRKNGAGGLQDVQWLAQTFLQSALDGSNAWKSIDQLAEKIRAGKATDEAILEMLIEQKGEEIATRSQLSAIDT
ncbi:hypothetical protein NPS49_08580 [Pseudomonas putida]|uniref:hypothetical protein n=1 Tax=Pseudomonas putida TaxID=303 RepID=UPI00236475AE|nr:hypothetical protein [Pseudomonas putida]MDD2068378.1 hypothetical protein [Pseudomonas putida]HDS1739553.1 hypothetical protein [Pseudomonas putida]